MKKAQLIIRFDKEKLDALQYYLNLKGKNLENELKNFIELAYEAQVPQDVKNFIRYQEKDNTGENCDAAEQDNAEKGSKTRRNKSERQNTAASETNETVGSNLEGEEDACPVQTM